MKWARHRPAGVRDVLMLIGEPGFDIVLKAGSQSTPCPSQAGQGVPRYSLPEQEQQPQVAAACTACRHLPQTSLRGCALNPTDRSIINSRGKN